MVGMRIFVAGATGALGVPLVRRLVAAGHQVTGLTRRPEKQAALRALGASPAVADVLDMPRLQEALLRASPEVVVHLLTSLPAEGPRTAADLEPTNRLRTTGTANLVQAAVVAGARRIVAESIVLVYGYGDLGARPLTEADPVAVTAPTPILQPTIDAGKRLEELVLGAARDKRIEGIVLRYGYVYGAEAGSTRATVALLRQRRLPLVGGGAGVWSWVHLDDAAAATQAAVERGTSGEVYNVVDDEPVVWRDYLGTFARLVGAPRPFSVPAWAARLAAPYATFAVTSKTPVSNAKAKAALGWVPLYPTYREGLAQVAAALGR